MQATSAGAVQPLVLLVLLVMLDSLPLPLICIGLPSRMLSFDHESRDFLSHELIESFSSDVLSATTKNDSREKVPSGRFLNYPSIRVSCWHCK